MIATRIDPWTWQERYGYAQAWRVDGATGLVFVAGQGPVSPDGELVGAGDFEAQARATFRNLRTVLEAAGATVGAVVQVGALAVPGMMLEVEATAVVGGRREQS